MIPTVMIKRTTNLKVHKIERKKYDPLFVLWRFLENQNFTKHFLQYNAHKCLSKMMHFESKNLELILRTKKFALGSLWMLNYTSLIRLITWNFVCCARERTLNIEPWFISHGSFPTYASSVCPESSGENKFIWHIYREFRQNRHLRDIGDYIW